MRSNIRPQKNSKDCLSCCLEYITGIHYSSIPKFYELEDKEAIKKYDEWLYVQGYMRVNFDVTQAKSGLNFYPESSIKKINPYKKFLFIGILKKKGQKNGHAIVFEELGDLKYKVHDPMVKQFYDYDKDLIGFEMIVRIPVN